MATSEEERQDEPEPARLSPELRAQALDLLIEQEHKLLAAYQAHQASADARTTAAPTAAFALLTVATTVAKSVGALARCVPYTVLGLIALAALVALTARVAGFRLGNRGDAEPLVLAESMASRDAVLRLWSGAVDDADPNTVRELALKLWRGRATDAREAYIAKESGR